jgi:hypothetical protein
MHKQFKIEYIKDEDVDPGLDRELRNLLTICFTKPEDAIFLKRRYFREPPQHRWMIRVESTKIIAHIAIHEKVVKAKGKTYRIGGIAEVSE